MVKWLVQLPGIAVLFICACSGQSPYQTRSEVLSVQDYSKELQSLADPQLLDVRTEAEFASGHIDGAVNINVLNQKSFKSAIQKLDPKRPVFLYCQAGSRSQRAAVILTEKGFEQVIDLEGGYTAWLNEQKE